MNIATKKRNPFIRRAIDYCGRVFFVFLSKINHWAYKRYYPSFLKWQGIRVEGKPVFIAPTAFFDSGDYSLITIHAGCVISGYVRLMTHDPENGS